MKLNLVFGAAALALLAACTPPAPKQEAPAASASAPIAIDVPAGIYALEPTHASVTFKIKHMGLSNYTARFTRMDAAINFDPNAPEKSKLVAVVDPASVQTDYPGDYKGTHKESPFKTWNEDLARSDKFFNSDKFPTIRFVSTSVEKTGEDTGKITGDLTLLGVTKPLTLDVKFNGFKNPHPHAQVAALGFSAHGAIKRADWGMAFGAGALGDDVEVIVEAELLQADPSKPAPAAFKGAEGLLDAVK